MKQTVLFGIKPTGEFHLGHLLTLRNVDDIKYQLIILIADLHALSNNTLKNEKIEYFTQQQIKIINFFFPKAIIIIQSQIIGIQECFFNLLPFINVNFKLKRMHLIKNKSSFNALEYNYPILMTLDLILFNTDYVLIGQDQIQHIELYKYVLKEFHKKKCLLKIKLVDVIVQKNLLLGIDNRKMSKSFNNCISFLDSPENIKKNIMKIQTHSNIQFDNNINNMLLLFQKPEIILERYANNTSYYVEKNILLNEILYCREKILSHEINLENSNKFLKLIKNRLKYINNEYKKSR